MSDEVGLGYQGWSFAAARPIKPVTAQAALALIAVARAEAKRIQGRLTELEAMINEMESEMRAAEEVGCE